MCPFKRSLNVKYYMNEKTEKCRHETWTAEPAIEGNVLLNQLGSMYLIPLHLCISYLIIRGVNKLSVVPLTAYDVSERSIIFKLNMTADVSTCWNHRNTLHSASRGSAVFYWRVCHVGRNTANIPVGCCPGKGVLCCENSLGSGSVMC